ncbi:oligosaccharide flippase family protein, partial [Candidatus Woesearchaeota archaeon]|nr:oligosaccharide flippase family protein [Candidatus Woesearchaeota archaeon]
MLKNKIAKNVTLSFLGDIFVKLIGFLVVIAIARFLGDASLGTYSFIITLVWIVFKISELGLDMIIRRDIAREKEKVNSAFFSNILSLRILTAILAFLITL